MYISGLHIDRTHLNWNVAEIFGKLECQVIGGALFDDQGLYFVFLVKIYLFSFMISPASVIS